MQPEAPIDKDRFLSSNFIQLPTFNQQATMTERCSLPLEKVFPIQIGTESFRLSGASIASDGISPTYAGVLDAS